MTLFRSKREVFIVRIWREAREGGRSAPEWRGVVESVQDGQRCYVKDLKEVMTFINHYLAGMGVNLERRWPIKQRRPAPRKANQSQSASKERSDNRYE
jgi:hypothetical protein